jgi:hypothetical protein
VEWAIMKLAETLVLVGVVGWYVVGESEEEESEGFSWDEVKAGLLDAVGVWFGFERAAKGVRGLLHLFESVHNRGVEFMFVGEMVLEVTAGCKCLWIEGTPVVSRELTEEAMEVELAECRGDVLTVLTVKEGELARVHPGALNCRE